MMALRQIQDVKSGTVLINLPTNFRARRVEVIIRPLEDTSEAKTTLLDLLLAAPTLNDVEVQEYKKVRDWMNQWNVKEF